VKKAICIKLSACGKKVGGREKRLVHSSAADIVAGEALLFCIGHGFLFELSITAGGLVYKEQCA